jgi:hypothetical protein
MKQKPTDDRQDWLITNLDHLWMDRQDQLIIAKTIQTLYARYDLRRKIASEPGVAEIIEQMVGRLAHSYPRLSELQGKNILDIAVNTPFGEISFGRSGRSYTALFEPWFCRILYELGAAPVGVDFGDLEHEVFIHRRADLGKAGALDFLPDHSFDGVQDSRLFGSPEFTAQFPDQADRLVVAGEIVRQERRLLKTGGIVIHSDAAVLLK